MSLEPLAFGQRRDFLSLNIWMVSVFDSSDSLSFGACCPKTIVAKSMRNPEPVGVARSFRQRGRHYWNCENALNGLSAETAANNSSPAFSIQLSLCCLEPRRPGL